VYICGRLRQRRLATQCLVAAAHVSRNSDDERGSLQRFRHLSGSPSALSTATLWQRLGGSHGTQPLLLHTGLDPAFWIQAMPVSDGRPTCPTPNTVASCCSCAGPFGKRGGHSPAKSVSTAHRSWHQTDSDLSASSTTMVTGTAAVPRPLLVLGDTLTCVSFSFEPDSGCVDTFAALTPHYSLRRPSISSMVSVPRSADR
jgi:hypothetical protein